MKYMVYIISSHKDNGKFAKNQFVFDDKESVSRCFMSFKPMRNYLMVGFEVEVVETLVH